LHAHAAQPRISNFHVAISKLIIYHQACGGFVNSVARFSSIIDNSFVGFVALRASRFAKRHLTKA